MYHVACREQGARALLAALLASGVVAQPQCRFANSNIGWTGQEDHAHESSEQSCRAKCVSQVGDPTPCCGWVYLGNGDCYQKYDTGSGCPLKVGDPDGNYGSDAGLVYSSQHADANIGFTGKEDHAHESSWQSCRAKCVSQADGPTPCCGWVFLGNTDCYQKYDTGSGCSLNVGGDYNFGSSAGLVPVCPMNGEQLGESLVQPLWVGATVLALIVAGLVSGIILAVRRSHHNIAEQPPLLG